MGNYRSRRPGMLQGWQINAAEMMFQGLTDEDIVKELWPEKQGKSIQNAKQRLRNLRKNEIFQDYYRTIITEWSVHNVGKALNKLSQQIDSDKEWLANKAANDVITQSRTLVTGTDDNSVVIKVEGMPELGVPEE